MDKNRYFQNPKVVNSNDYQCHHHQQQQQPPSSASIWSMMIHGNRSGLFAKTAPHSPEPIRAEMAAPWQPEKDLVGIMDQQLKQLTKELMQKQQQVGGQIHNHHQYSQPPQQQQQQQQMNGIFSFLDAQARTDFGMNYSDIDDDDVARGREQEHLAGPVYFTGDEDTKATASPPKRDGFLPAAFNSIRTLVGNVFRLPSLIMNSTWIDHDESNRSTPRHYTNNNHNTSSSSCSGREAADDRSKQDHLFFDLDDIDFLPESDEFATPGSDSACHEDDDIDDDDESFFLDVLGNEKQHYETTIAEHQHQQQQQKKEAIESSETNSAVLDNAVSVPERRELPPTATTTTTTSAIQSTHANSNTDSCISKINHSENNNMTQTPTAIETAESSKKLSSPVDIIKSTSDSSTSTCARRFISTPEQECTRMSVVRPRKRQQQHEQLLTRSTPIAVKVSANSQQRYRPNPRTLYQSSQSRRNVHKNRKEKRRHEIHSHIYEDFDSSDASSYDPHHHHYSSSSFADNCDDDLLPPTARNPIEPSFFAGDSSMNSSTGSSVSGARARRNSLNFMASSYDKEFPRTLGEQRKAAEGATEVEEDVNLKVTKKSNGAVYFEIPNTPQRLRRVLVPPKVTPMKPRTTSVVSSSVGSSPATSFDSAGKFWGGSGRGAGCGRRTRTVSEGSEDDLIEFVAEDGDYLADVFSDTDDNDDEDYSSDEEEEGSEEEESDGDDADDDTVETEDEDDVEDVVELERLKKRHAADLPDSGVEEKKVRFGAKPQVRMLCTWDFAHRQARKGHWEEVGRDRVRFADRIRRVEAQLKPVLGGQHRERVFQERFTQEASSR